VAEHVRQIADELDVVISAAQIAHISASGRNLGITMHGRKRTKGERRQIRKLIANPLRRRTESNRRKGLCRPLPKPLGHAAVRQHGTGTA
jgi:hypothetical protein